MSIKSVLIERGFRSVGVRQHMEVFEKHHDNGVIQLAQVPHRIVDLNIPAIVDVLNCEEVPPHSKCAINQDYVDPVASKDGTEESGFKQDATEMQETMETADQNQEEAATKTAEQNEADANRLLEEATAPQEAPMPKAKKGKGKGKKGKA